jgi:IclR family acetate operon transcriptional repressor
MAKKQPQKKSRGPYPEFEEDLERGPATSATARALAILHAISATDSSVSAVELAPQLGLPKPTVHRLMQVLEYIGYLQREPGSKRFIIGPMQTEMALETLIHSPQRSIRHNILSSLSDELRETCNITALAGNEIVCVDRVENNWPLRSRIPTGWRVPLHCTASGKIFLSQMPAHKRRRLLNAVPLRKFTEKTVTLPAQIEKDLKQIRSSRTALEQEEYLPGMLGIAVPVLDLRGRVCATVSVSSVMSKERHDLKKVLGYVPAMNRAAEAITETLKDSSTL